MDISKLTDFKYKFEKDDVTAIINTKEELNKFFEENKKPQRKYNIIFLKKTSKLYNGGIARDDIARKISGNKMYWSPLLVSIDDDYSFFSFKIR